jgi:superoxide dismutase, Fe-Mn family
MNPLKKYCMSATTFSRKKFIATAVGVGLVPTLFPALSVAGKGIVPTPDLLGNRSGTRATTTVAPTGFDQTPLPYAYNALEPWIDAQTMELHYSKHAAAYSKNAKEAATAEKIDTAKQPIENILVNISKYSAKMRNNAGGHYNHELFWSTLQPNGESKPTGGLLTGIEKNFGHFDTFKTQFSDAAKTCFGSGWAWLLITKDKKLAVGNTPNQDNPLMEVAALKGFPLLGLDVWEHAYYLKYQNLRATYIENWWKIVNWQTVQQRYESFIHQK